MSVRNRFSDVPNKDAVSHLVDEGSHLAEIIERFGASLRTMVCCRPFASRSYSKN